MQQKGLDFGGAPAPRPPAARRALSVSQLTERIQGDLETTFFDVWVEGEISNLTIAPSGHWYFSLKDDKAQVRAVVWKSATRLIRFRPKDGLKVLARGGIKVYAPKGEYQLAVEVLEPLGKGSLQAAYEELKLKLEREGLFAAARKRPLPLLPRCVGVVTSPTGSVIQDILRVLARRYANLEVVLYPARVQGVEAAGEIAQGIRVLNGFKRIDVIIVARGGGTLEDLWPFNDEQVARALAGSRIPTISAVGHETDYTIADFVADLRAPTPSSAAERVVQAKEEFGARIEALRGRLGATLELRMTRTRARLARLTAHRVFEAERGRLRTHAQRVDELVRRARTALLRRLERSRDRLAAANRRTEAFRWERQLEERRQRVERLSDRLLRYARGAGEMRRLQLGRLLAQLDGLSPLAVLSRGYALVFDRQGRLVRVPGDVAKGDSVRLRVHGGELSAVITEEQQ